MELEEALTRWTIRFALALAVAAWGVQLTRTPAGRWRDAARGLWTLGLAAYLAHVAAAFAFFHAWSHHHAYRATALETERVVGIAWGGGLYFNYLFTVLWMVDVGWWWASPRSHSFRPRWLATAWHAFFALIAFNGAVVFESGPVRWAGLAACGVLLGCWRRGRSRRAAQVV